MLRENSEYPGKTSGDRRENLRLRFYFFHNLKISILFMKSKTSERTGGECILVF